MNELWQAGLRRDLDLLHRGSGGPAADTITKSTLNQEIELARASLNVGRSQLAGLFVFL